MTDMMQALGTIRSIYQALEDEESKDTFMNRLAWCASNDTKYLAEMCLAFKKRALRVTYIGPETILSRRDLKIKQMLDSVPKGRKFVLYGAGQDGALILPDVESDERFIGFCSGSKAKQEKGYLGFPVMSPEELLSRKDLYAIIATYAFKDEITQILKDGGFPQEQIIDGPAFYRIPPDENEEYFGPGFMKFQDEEVFVDAGCFDFHTSLNLSRHCKRMKAYAFEPDPKNYQTCLKNIERRNKERVTDVKIFPCGTWSERTTLYFHAEGTAGSCVCAEDEENCSSISVMPIDEAIDPGDRVTMIKMDVEGSELESLKGARQTIMRDKPKLAVCIYHKIEDLWEIPQYIKSLVPEYRLYIRQHSDNRYNTILYAIIPE